MFWSLIYTDYVKKKKKERKKERTIHISYLCDRLKVFEVLEIHSCAVNLFLIYNDTWHWADAFRNPGMKLSKSLSRDKSNTEWDWFFIFFFKLSFHWKWMLANALGKLEEYGTFCPGKLCRKWWKTTRSHSHMNFKNSAKKRAFNTGLSDSVPYWTDRQRGLQCGSSRYFNRCHSSEKGFFISPHWLHRQYLSGQQTMSRYCFCDLLSRLS